MKTIKFNVPAAALRAGVIGSLLTFLLLFFHCGSAFAALDLSEIGVGARPLGMGKAFVGLADDASAIFLNPAGLSRNSDLNFVSMAGNMLGDVNYLQLGVAGESMMGKFGFGFVNASVGSIPLTTITGSGSTAAISQYDSTDYNSSLVYFSYGSKLSRFLKNGVGSNLAVGLSLKYFLQGFNGGGVAMQDANGGGMDADFGLLWDINHWATLGANFQNFLPINFGGKFVWQKNQLIEGIPLVTRLGGNFKVIGPSGIRNLDGQRLDIAVDYEKSDIQGYPALYHFGCEYSPVAPFHLRAGVDQKPKATESGSGVDNNLTAGVGVTLGGFTFDYAYHQFGDLTENTTHFFSIGYRGEEKIREKNREYYYEKRNPSIPTPEVAPKPLLKSFSDVPEDYWAHKPIIYLATLGIMDGYYDETFKPTKEINRGELAVLLVKAKGFTVGEEVKVKFSDVILQSFEAPYISYAVEKKYVNGYPDGTFRPEKRVTRAEAAVIIARFAGLYLKSKVSQPVFADLPASHWASPAVAAAKDEGFFEYLGGNAFGPNLYLTRAEAAEIISKTAFAKHKIEELISGDQDQE